MQGKELETLVSRIASLDRAELVAVLRGLDCDFRLDFTDEFLSTVSIERLQHIVLAASLHAHHLPAVVA